MIIIFNIKHIFYEIEGLETDLLVGYNLFKKIGVIIDTKMGVIQYHGKEENLLFHNKVCKENLWHTEEKSNHPLNEFLINKYFNQLKQVKSYSVCVETSDYDYSSELERSKDFRSIKSFQSKNEDLRSITSQSTSGNKKK